MANGLVDDWDTVGKQAESVTASVTDHRLRVRLGDCWDTSPTTTRSASMNRCRQCLEPQYARHDQARDAHCRGYFHCAAIQGQFIRQNCPMNEDGNGLEEAVRGRSPLQTLNGPFLLLAPYMVPSRPSCSLNNSSFSSNYLNYRSSRVYDNEAS